MDMVEQDGLIDGDPRKNWKEGKEDSLGLNPKSMVGNDDKKKQEDGNDEKADPLPHTYNLYWKGLQSVKQNPVENHLLALNPMKWYFFKRRKR